MLSEINSDIEKQRMSIMTFNIRRKLFIPLLIAVVVLGGIGWMAVDWQLSELRKNFTYRLAEEKMSEINQSITTASQQALEKASLFIRMPEIIRAYELAHSGNIDDEADGNTQHARNMIRYHLKPIQDGFSGVIGQKLKLHFHLSNARSFVRVWQDKQIFRDGQWTDISDDLSRYRSTVGDVNRSGQPLRGIELGQGGFAIRGIAPLSGSQGMPLGSVEVLSDRDPLLKAASANEKQKLLLYMNADLLPITSYQDANKYPILDKKYVLVSEIALENRITDSSLLDMGREKLNVAYKDSRAIAAFPVKDYKDRQIGVIAFVFDISYEQFLTRSVHYTLNGALLTMILVIGVMGSLILSWIVLKPAKRIYMFSKAISEGDMSRAIDIKYLHSKDEMTILSETLNEMAASLNRMIKDIASGIDTLVASVHQISAEVDQQAAIAMEQSSSVSEITATMSELLASSVQIAENSNTVARIADSALQHTKSGAEWVELVTSKMNKINDDNQNTVRKIISLGKKSEEIEKIMEIINNIADQTKLIAFNAALEASSAGEAGKRFGVVAVEIRRLAENVMESTGDIESRITEIREAVQDMIIASEKGSKRIQEGLEYSGQTAVKLRDIVKGVESTADAAKQISLSTQQQKSASEQILNALKEIDTAGRQASDSVAQISTVSKNLADLSAKLENLVKRFRLSA